MKTKASTAIGIFVGLVCSQISPQASTLSRSYNLPGVMRLFNPLNGSSCTGTNVSPRGNIVATAAHCLANVETGGLMIASDNYLEPLGLKGHVILSKKVYISRDSAFQAKLSELIDLLNDLKLAENSFNFNAGILPGLKHDLQRAQNSLPGVWAIDKNRRNELQKEVADFTARIADAETKIRDLKPSIEDLKKQSKKLQGEYLRDYVAHEFVLVEFDIPHQLQEKIKKDEFRLTNDRFILPLANSDLPFGSLMLMGGFGQFTPEGNLIPAREPYITSNILLTHNAPKTGLIYSYGFVTADEQAARMFGANRIHMGSILKGDSGGPLLSSEGLSGVSSGEESFDAVLTTTNPPEASVALFQTPTQIFSSVTSAESKNQTSFSVHSPSSLKISSPAPFEHKKFKAQKSLFSSSTSQVAAEVIADCFRDGQEVGFVNAYYRKELAKEVDDFLNGKYRGEVGKVFQ